MNALECFDFNRITLDDDPKKRLFSRSLFSRSPVCGCLIDICFSRTYLGAYLRIADAGEWIMDMDAPDDRKH